MPPRSAGRSGAVPGPVTSPASAGCHRLLREFDAVCVVDADQMAELAGGGCRRSASPAERDADDETGTSRRVSAADSTPAGRAVGRRSRRHPHPRCDEHPAPAGAARGGPSSGPHGHRGDGRPRPARGRGDRRTPTRGLGAPTCRMSTHRHPGLPLGWRREVVMQIERARQVSGGEAGDRPRERHPPAARGSTARRASPTPSERWTRWSPNSPVWATASTRSS